MCVLAYVIKLLLIPIKTRDKKLCQSHGSYKCNNLFYFKAIPEPNQRKNWGYLKKKKNFLSTSKDVPKLELKRTYNIPAIIYKSITYCPETGQLTEAENPHRKSKVCISISH